jgi:hypothetical protein
MRVHPDSLRHEHVRKMSGQECHPRGRRVFHQLRHDVKRVSTGKIDVKQCDVRLRSQHDLGAIVSGNRSARDGKFRSEIKQRGERFYDNSVVINDDDPDGRRIHDDAPSAAFGPLASAVFYPTRFVNFSYNDPNHHALPAILRCEAGV